jgi:hypothetical protein
MEVALLTVVAACWAILGTGAVTGLVGAWSRGGRGRARELDRVWQGYAWSKRFRFRPATGDWPRARAPRIEGRVRDVPLVIEACTMTVRGAPRPCTRVWARSSAPSRARLVVSSDPLLVQGPRVHDLDRVRLGDPFFDHALAVRASSAEAAHRLLLPPLRRSLQGLLSASYRLAMVMQVDDGEVSLTWLGEETRPAMLDEVCAVVANACEAPAGGDAYR